MSKKANVNVENDGTKKDGTIEVLATKKAKFAEGCKKVGSKAGKALKWVGIGAAGLGLAALGYGVGRGAGRREESSGFQAIDLNEADYSNGDSTEE